MRPARCVGHCISQVYFDGRWNLLDGDMGPFYLLRDNATIAERAGPGRDHDLLKRTHTHGIIDPDSRTAAEGFRRAVRLRERGKGNRNSVRDTTMNMVLRPNEALVWRWGHLVPLKYHGRTDIKVFGPRIRTGQGLGRPRGGADLQRPVGVSPGLQPGNSGARERNERPTSRSSDGELVPRPGRPARSSGRCAAPIRFVGGTLDVEGTGRSSPSPGMAEVARGGRQPGRPVPFPAQGRRPLRILAQVRAARGTRLKRLAIVNDLQMAPLALPGHGRRRKPFTYSDQTAGTRQGAHHP